MIEENHTWLCYFLLFFEFIDYNWKLSAEVRAEELLYLCWLLFFKVLSNLFEGFRVFDKDIFAYFLGIYQIGALLKL